MPTRSHAGYAPPQPEHATARPADPVTADYLRRCAEPGSALPDAWATASLPPALAAAAGHRLLHRPLFAAEEQVARAAADSAALFDLLTSLPERLFDGDLDAYCAAIGVTGPMRELVTRFGGTAPPRYGRTDMYEADGAFRLLEFNIASELGGIDRAGALPRLWSRIPAFADFAERHRLGHLDTGLHVAATLREAARPVAGADTPSVVLLEAPGGLAAFGAVWEALAELMRGHGLDFRVAELQDVHVVGDRVTVGGARVHLVLRCFSAEELLTRPRGRELAEPLFRAHQSGAVVLWTPMESYLFSNKTALALLSAAAEDGRLDATETALVDRLLPWTRALPGAPRLAAPDLFDVCLARRHELVLKPAGGYGGSGVVAGWEQTPDQWRRALDAVDEAGAVVQQRVVPRTEPVVDPATGRTEAWHAVWSLFLTPQGHAGTYARAVPAGDGAVIGMGANPRARTAAVFTYPPASGTREVR